MLYFWQRLKRNSYKYVIRLALASTLVSMLASLGLAACDVALPAPSPAPAGRLLRTPNAVEPVASYTMVVSLDPASKTLTGRQNILYRNTSDIPIPDLVFHLYLNAFSSRDTLFMREGGGMMRGEMWDVGSPGFIEVDAIQLADGTPLTVTLVEDGTLARAELPAPVPAGGSAEIRINFHARLPKAFARTGFVGEDFFMVGQWFPKLGVWEGEDGWNAHPFHANAEFYADFGNYDVSITLPDNYVTGGVGVLESQVDNGDGTQTVRYQAEQVIDFAWTASPHFQIARRRITGIEIIYLYLPEHAWSVERALNAATAAVLSFGRWYGPYPYPRLTVVDVPDDGSGAGGMEYPTLVTAGVSSLTGAGPGMAQMGFEKSIELVVIHEIGHQWWQSMVAFNEAEEPWLDEGFTDYSSVRLATELYGQGSAIDAGDVEASYLDLRRMEYMLNPQVPMYGAAWDFQMIEYGIAAYSKPAISLLTLERILGEETMLNIMSTFFERYQFAHPTTEDFRQVAEEVAGQDLTWFFEGLVYGDDYLNYVVTGVDERSVTVERQGDLIIPTQIEVTFEDGSTVLETWSGQDKDKVLTFPNRPNVVSAVIDPQRRILLDLRWADNGMSTSPQLSPWLAVVVRTLYAMQSALLNLGGL